MERCYITDCQKQSLCPVIIAETGVLLLLLALQHYCYMYLIEVSDWVLYLPSDSPADNNSFPGFQNCWLEHHFIQIIYTLNKGKCTCMKIKEMEIWFYPWSLPSRKTNGEQILDEPFPLLATLIWMVIKVQWTWHCLIHLLLLKSPFVLQICLELLHNSGGMVSSCLIVHLNPDWAVWAGTLYCVLAQDT